MHDNIDYVPYYGSMKGAREVLWQKEGNDMDQASLLIAMYRHCGIPARYVVGTVEVPIEKAMNWAGGFTDKASAVSAFYLGGIPRDNGYIESFNGKFRDNLLNCELFDTLTEANQLFIYSSDSRSSAFL